MFGWPFKKDVSECEKVTAHLRKCEHERLLEESGGKTIRVVPLTCEIGFKVQWLFDGRWHTIKEGKSRADIIRVVDEIKEIENQRTMKPEYF